MFEQFRELFITFYFLVAEVLTPEFGEQIKNMGANKNFDPAKDVPSLDGKVVIVTGGES